MGEKNNQSMSEEYGFIVDEDGNTTEEEAVLDEKADKMLDAKIDKVNKKIYTEDIPKVINKEYPSEGTQGMVNLSGMRAKGDDFTKAKKRQAEQDKKKADWIKGFFDDITRRKEYGEDSDVFKGLSPQYQQMLRYLSLPAPEQVKANFDYEINQQKMISELRSNVTKNVLGAYATSGKLDFDKMMELAEGRITKNEPSRGALDRLQEKGAFQMERPEIPDRDAIKLANIISTTVAGLVQNISMQGSNVGGVVQQAGLPQQVAHGAMLANDIATVEKKRERVKELNFMLDKEHEGNVLNALSAYEDKADASERMYQNQKLAEVNRMVNRFDKYMGINLALSEKIANIEGSKGTAQRSIDMFNVQQRNAYNRANAQLKGQIYMAQLKGEETAKQYKLPSYQYTYKNIALAGKAGLNMGLAEKAVVGLNRVDGRYVRDNYNDVSMYNSSFKGKLKEMVTDGKMTIPEAKTAYNNAIYMNNQGFSMSTFKENDLKVLGSKDRTVAATWQQSMESGEMANLLNNGSIRKSGSFSKLVAYGLASGIIADVGTKKLKVYKGDPVSTQSFFDKGIWSNLDD